MAKFKFVFLAVAVWLLGGAAHAQSTNRFRLTIAPPANTVMITETTNLLTVAIANLFATNQVTEETEEGTVTNTVVTPIFSNVVITASYPGGKAVTLGDTGAKPDAKAGDSIFSGNFIAPTTKVALDLTLTFSIKGNDITATNESGEIQALPVSTTSRVVYKIYPRPINDQFTNAFKIESEGGVFTTYEAFVSGNADLMTNNYASVETGEPAHGTGTSSDASVWWMWSYPARTNVLIDLAGSSFNPVLGIYTGTEVKSLTLVTNASSSGKKAAALFTAEAGRTYRIAIASPDTNIASQGSIRLRVAPGASLDTAGPSTQLAAPADGSLFTYSNVVFSGTSAEPAGLQSGLSKVYLKINGGSAQLAGTGSPWSKSLNLPPGTNTVEAYAVDFAGNTGPSASITVIFMNPTNDFFGNAIKLSGVQGAVTAINGRATKEAGEPIHGGNEGGRSIWYRFQAPTDGILSLTTSNSTFDTLLSVYSGDSVSALTSIASNDDAYQGSGWSSVECRVASNVVYHIAVDGYGGVSGNVALRYGFVAKAPESYYMLNLTAPEGGKVTPGERYFPIGSTVTLKAVAEAEYAFVGWEGDFNTTNNPLTFAMTGDKTLVARFRYVNYTEDFESGAFNSKLAWTFGGKVPWVVQPNLGQGQFSARSGLIGDGQQSKLRLTVKSLGGQASFDYRVSSEYPYDRLEFSLNGVKLKEWSGDLDWRAFNFDVPAGTNVLEWTYSKDSNFSEGLDAAFVDNLSLPQGSLAAVVSATTLADRTVRIVVQGRADQTYRVQASSNLADWTTIATGTTVGGQFEVVDANATGQAQRYYRAVTP